MGELVAGVLEKCVNDGELAAPEVVTIPAEVGEQRVGLLREGCKNPLLDLAALGGVDDSVAHGDQSVKVSLHRL